MPKQNNVKNIINMYGGKLMQLTTTRVTQSAKHHPLFVHYYQTEYNYDCSLVTHAWLVVCIVQVVNSTILLLFCI